MNDTEKERLLGTSIAELAEKNNWPTQMWRDVVRFCYSPPDYGRKNRKEENEILRDLAGKTPLRDLLRGMDVLYGKYRIPSKFHESFRSWRKKLVELGLTRFDSITLPQDTVTTEMIRAVPKEKLLQMDARILGTISSTLLGYYRYKDSDYKDLDSEDELLPFPTVAELIAKEPHWSFHEEALTATLQLLNEMGFTYDDGPFFQEGTRKKFIEDLAREEGISLGGAHLVATIAEKHGWVKFPGGKDK